MRVELLNSTPLWVCSKAIRKCWSSEDKSDTHIMSNGRGGHMLIIGEKDKELIERVGNKNKHKSTLEHLVYTFDIDGIPRYVLQELARHRMASYSVKSSRYTIKEIKNEEPFCNINITDEQRKRAGKYIHLTGNNEVDDVTIAQLEMLRQKVASGMANDKVKPFIPEAYKTSLVMTINARSLQNFLELRTSKSALWEIQDLAKSMYEELPDEHKYLFKDYINETK